MTEVAPKTARDDAGCDDAGCDCETCAAFCDEDRGGACVLGDGVFGDGDCAGGEPSCANAVPPPVIAVASKSAASLARWL